MVEKLVTPTERIIFEGFGKKEENQDKKYPKKRYKKIEEKETKIDPETLKKEIRKAYKQIVEILRYYMDIENDDYLLIATWIIGTYLHNEFSTYPYLYFNAMRGSGKSRVLNLITHLSKDGDKLTSLTEAVLFRERGTLCIDEFEGVGKTGSENLRELLNTAYKKGGVVKRARKIKTIEGEDQAIQRFEVYRPIVMANIWGIEEVLGDRCIEIILEKSNKSIITKIIENFDNNVQIKEALVQISKGIGQCGHLDGIFNTAQEGWNNFVKGGKYVEQGKSTMPITPILSTLSTLSLLYNKINKTELEGRDLELFLPLFLIADLCGILDKMLKISIRVTKRKKEKDVYESKDIQLYDFISKFENLEYIKVSELNQKFRIFIGSEEKDKWPNTWWLGQALKRLKLIKEKKRSNGTLVILDKEKAQKKYKIFKIPEEKQDELKQDKELPIKIEKIDSIPIAIKNKGSEEKR